MRPEVTKDINVRALRMLEPGGVLVTCSCSHHISEAMLLEIVADAALDAGTNASGPRTSSPGPRSPDFVDRPRDALSEVPGIRNYSVNR